MVQYDIQNLRFKRRLVAEYLLYNALALTVVLYGSETWTVKARDGRRITAAEMEYIRKNSRIHFGQITKQQ